MRKKAATIQKHGAKESQKEEGDILTLGRFSLA